MSEPLTHVDVHGAARMVDIGEKAVSRRTAMAQAVCSMSPETANAIRKNSLKKGDVLQAARFAAIGAAKRTDDLIPLCHTLPLESLAVEFEWLDDARVKILVTAGTTGKTGVEMEAMVGASMGALTIYDMCKAMDREIRIDDLMLLSKTGGSRGDFFRESEDSIR